ncbi:hypothetical protein JCM19240_2743 [Vibrio maritimus]|uniref:DUF4381 domain-containing protein n=1 Tax=Vibrio maritimus TaxID=990268 RepID=A0A090TD32_9VIBR|nr:hypothetical protein JCM19240_2743 [Vibrio maritimus]
MNASTQTHPLPLKPLHLPEAPEMWPLPWGYWAVIATIVITALLLIWLARYCKRKARAKKAAIKLIEANVGSSPSSAIEIVRQAALSYFPREDIAKLSGEQWLAFLDSQLDNPRFRANYPQWQHVLYQKAVTSNDTRKEEDHTLVDDCIHWLHHALPPKRKFRNWKQS